MIEHNGKFFTTTTECLQFCAGYNHVPADILRNAADRGTRAHSAIASTLKGLGTWGADEDLQGYLNSFDYIKDKIGAIKVMEERYFDDNLLLTGQVDLIAEFEKVPYLKTNFDNLAD